MLKRTPNLLVALAVVLLAAASARAQAKASVEGAHPKQEAAASKGAAVAVVAAPKVGEPAPDFKLPYATQEGRFTKPDELMSLASLKGKNVILAFKAGDKKDYDALRAELEKLK